MLLTCQDNLKRYLLRTVAKYSVHILSVGALPRRCTLRLSKKLHADSESVTLKNVKKATCKKLLHSKKDLLVQYCNYLTLPLSHCRDKCKKEACRARNADQGVSS